MKAPGIRKELEEVSSTESKIATGRARTLGGMPETRNLQPQLGHEAAIIGNPTSLAIPDSCTTSPKP